MDEEQEDVVVEEEPKKKLGGLAKKLILYGGIVVVQAALAVVLAHFVILPRLPASGESDSLMTEEVVEAEEKEPSERGTILMMEDVVVNLVDEDGTHFLKVATGLEFTGKDLEAEITERMPELRGLVIDHFSSRTVAEVVRRDGRERVKEDLLEDFNSRLTEGELLNIYFSDFVVQ